MKTHLSRLVEQAAKGQELVTSPRPASRWLGWCPSMCCRPPLVRWGFWRAQWVIEVDLKSVLAQNIDAMCEAGK